MKTIDHIVIEMAEDGNERSREGRNGRVYNSTTTRNVWLIRLNGTLLDDEWRTWKLAGEYATRKYPAADIRLK